MQSVSFQGIYRLDSLTTYNQGEAKPYVSKKPIPNSFKLPAKAKLSYALGEYNTPTLKAAREFECLEDFIANRPLQKLGKTILFWMNGNPYAVTNDENGQDYKAYKTFMKPLERKFKRIFQTLQAKRYQETEASAGSDHSLQFIKTLTDSETEKRPYHLELTQKAVPAALEITRGGEDGFIVGYQFIPSSKA